MVEHRLVQYEPVFNKYVRDFEGDGEWSTSYLKRKGVYKPDFADNMYECTCGEFFGAEEERAERHVEEHFTEGL